jgi:hypothetical protein
MTHPQICYRPTKIIDGSKLVPSNRQKREIGIALAILAFDAQIEKC